MEQVNTLQEEYPDDEIQVWAFDEHRLGLKPIIKKVWSPKGLKPKATVNHRFEWFYLYAYVNPETGKTIWQILSTVNIEAFNASLQDFAKNADLSKGKQIILVLDRAGWHKSDKLVIPEGIHLKYLPAYSPELQPAERLWTLTDEPLINKCFDRIKDMINALSDRCCKLSEMNNQIKKQTLFYWWPKLNFSGIF